jgi:hypothetical protein
VVIKGMQVDIFYVWRSIAIEFTGTAGFRSEM